MSKRKTVDKNPAIIVNAKHIPLYNVLQSCLEAQGTVARSAKPQRQNKPVRGLTKGNTLLRSNDRDYIQPYLQENHLMRNASKLRNGIHVWPVLHVLMLRVIPSPKIAINNLYICAQFVNASVD
jgi:hypothetical protein